MSTINNKRILRDFYYNITCTCITNRNSFRLRIRVYLSQYIWETKHLDEYSLILKMS